MSDDERMDRARRIRQMREGRRSGEPDDESSAEREDTADAGEEQPTGDGDAAEQSVADASPNAEQAATERSVDETASERPANATNGEAPSTDGSRADGSPVGSASGTDAKADDAEIEGPASADEWFEDGTEETPTESAASTETASADSSEPPSARPSGSAEDADTAQTAAAAASAAAAFEVDEAEHEAQAAAAEESAATETDDEPEQEAEIRVLEFRLGEEHYCLDIEHVEEIVKEESVTRVPNTPDHVHGVVDLRGQITTILDPKIALDIDHDGDEQLIVVFDAETFDDQGHAGWIVDEVRQVLPITESEVKESPLDRKSIKGVIERDEEFVIWTTPQVALEQADE